MTKISAPESGRPRQNRVYGWLLLVTSWVMRLVGGLAVGVGVHEPATAFATAHDPGASHGPSPLVLSVIAVAAIALGSLLFTAGVRAGRRARRHLVRIIRSPAELAGRCYVLYLRPFRQDLPASGIVDSPHRMSPDEMLLRSGRTHEERLTKMFREFGPVVTVGRPGEQLPGGSGACRFYLPLDDWQEPVRRLIGNARVVLLGAGPGAGTIWEYTEVLQRADPRRLVVLVTHPEWFTRFKALSAAAVEDALPELRQRYGDQWQPPVLPSLPPPRRPATKATFYVQAMIYFGRDAGPVSLARFDMSALRGNGPKGYLKKTLQPVLVHLRAAETGRPASHRAATRKPTGRKAGR